MIERLSLHSFYAHHCAHHEGAVEKMDYLNRENSSGSKSNYLPEGNTREYLEEKLEQLGLDP